MTQLHFFSLPEPAPSEPVKGIETRLARECREVARRHGDSFTCYVAFRHPYGCWDSHSVVGIHRGIQITLRYSKDHPLAPPRASLSPAPDSDDYQYDGEGGYLFYYAYPHEWGAACTISTAITWVKAWIDDYLKDEVGS